MNSRREPNGRGRGVPDMDFAIDRAERELEPTIDTITVASFDDFYLRHRGPVGRALAITLRDDDLARDAVDEAMARAYQRWAHVSRLENPGGWVYRVGLNWSRSVLRRLRRPTPICIAEPADTSDPVVQDPTIDRARDALGVDQRAVVVCRLLLGLSEAQTAELLRIRPGTVKSRLARALDRLHPMLTHLQPPHEEDPR